MELNIYVLSSVAGAFLAILMYYLLQTDRICHKSFAYSFWNLIGSIFIAFSFIKYWNIGGLIIEIFWTSISIYGLYRYFKERKGLAISNERREEPPL